MYTPLNYNQINAAAGQYSPCSVKAYNNKTFDYWVRALFQRAASVIKLDTPVWSGETKDFLTYCLYRFGYVAVFDSDQYGLSFQPCTLYGYDFYYQPTEAIISNPVLNTRLKIHDDCELIKLTPDYIGIWDIIEYTAEKLSSMDTAVNMSIINNKIPYILGARNKAAAQALKKVMDKINKGEPLVIVDTTLQNDETDKDVPFQIFDREHLKESYITTDQLMDMQTILNNFDTEIGIQTIPYQKKERLVTSEADSKAEDSIARCTVWLETLNNSLQLVNGRFNTSFSASLRREEAGENGNRETDIIRS